MAKFDFSLRQSLRFRKAFFAAALLCAVSGAFGSTVVWAESKGDDNAEAKVIVNSLELGKDNDLEGDGIITIGDGNEQSSAKGTIVGWGNISRGSNALTIGSSNVVNGDGAMSFGISNESEGKDTLSIGKGNIITMGSDTNNQGRVVGIGYGNKATGENLVAVGIDTRANIKNASAFGVKSSAHGDGAVSIGYGNEATVNTRDENPELRPYGIHSVIKYSSTALGTANDVGGNNSSAIGFGNESQGNYVTAVGTANKAYGFQNSAFGFQNKVESGHKSSAIGSDNIIGGEHNTGLGYNNQIAGYIEATAVGSTNRSYGNYGAAFGYNNSITGFANSTAIGNNNEISSEKGTVVGSGNKLSSPDSARSIVLGVDNINYRGNSVLLGHDNKFEYGGTNSYIIGGNNEIWGDKAVVLGEGNQTTGTRAIVIGVDSHIWNSDSITLGNENNSGALQSAIVGNKSEVWAENGLAFGNESTVNGTNGVLLGNKNLANASNSVAIGNQSISLGEGALSIGNISTSNGVGSYVVGNNSGAYSENSFALGNNSVSIAADSVAVGNQSVASESNTVSFGHKAGEQKGTDSDAVYDTDLTSRLLNVTAGIDDTDAVNVSQLNDEKQARLDADTILQGNIDAEKTARENAVTEVTNALNTKVGALTVKDIELEGKIGDLNTSLITEAGKLNDKDIELEGKITAEKGTRESEVSRLDERIDNINTSIGNIGNAVYYDGSNKNKITLAGVEGTVIDNVKAGELSADSKEAVNGSQLYAEQKARESAVDVVEESLRTNVESLQQKDAEIQKSIADETKDRISAVNGLRDELTNFIDVSLENVVTYTDSTKTKVSLGRQGVGVLVTNLKDGEVSRGSTDAITGNQLYEEQQHRKNDIDNINFRIDNIEAVTGGNGIVYDDEDKSSVTLGGNDGTVIKNLADGAVAEGSKEAINGGQLYDEIQARIDADNALRQEFGNYVAGITEDAVSYDKDSDKSKVTFKGTDGTTLGNVAGGTIAEGSKEAVNGGQLYETNTKLEGLTNKVGTVKDGTFVKDKNTIGENINSLDEAVSANSSAIDEMSSRVSSGFSLLNDKVNNTGAHAAALAALHPVADDDSKVGFAAGIGSYHISRAAAIGMFYRPTDRYQFSLGGTTGNGEHMYNIGFAVGLDKVVDGPFANKKAMVREIVSLREEVAELREMLQASLEQKSK